MYAGTGMVLGVCGLALLASGCGGGLDYDVAPVKGTVTCNGTPVPGGQLHFRPINTTGAAEMPPQSFCVIDANGNFSIPDVVVGLHQIQFLRPATIDEEALEESEDDDDPESMLDMQADMDLAEKFKDIKCNYVAEPEVTIVQGENQLDIELTARRVVEED